MPRAIVRVWVEEYDDDNGAKVREYGNSYEFEKLEDLAAALFGFVGIPKKMPNFVEEYRADPH